MDEEKYGAEEGKAMDHAESKLDYDDMEGKMMDDGEMEEGKAGELEDGLGLDEDFGGELSTHANVNDLPFATYLLTAPLSPCAPPPLPPHHPPTDEIPHWANDENRSIDKKLRKKKEKLEKITKNVAENRERVVVMDDHLKNVKNEIVQVQQVVDAKNKEIKTEDHLKQLAERATGRVLGVSIVRRELIWERRRTRTKNEKRKTKNEDKKTVTKRRNKLNSPLNPPLPLLSEPRTSSRPRQSSRSSRTA